MVKHTWHVHLVWKPASSITTPGMSVCLTYLWIWILLTRQALIVNPVLLILDEWMLLKPTDTEQKDIFELLHRRRKKSSTIFCSQYVFEEWYDQLGGKASPLADAIIALTAHDNYQINITSMDAEHDRSMREVYGLNKSLRE